MSEETGTSGYDCSEEIPVMEVTSSLSRRTVRRSRNSGDDVDEDAITISGNGKKRRYSDVELRRDVDANVKFRQNVVSDRDHVNSVFMCSVNDDMISDLKAECVSETDNFNGFSRNTSTLSVVCLESEEEMESLSTVTVNRKTKMRSSTKTKIEATSRRKLPQPAVTMPSTAEIEEFFSKAEKYEQKRFAEKYNFDIVKDVPMEGRYQWVELKP